MGSGKEEEEDILAKRGKGRRFVRYSPFKDYSVNLNPLTYRDSLGVINGLRPPRAVSVEGGR